MVTPNCSADGQGVHVKGRDDRIQRGIIEVQNVEISLHHIFSLGNAKYFPFYGKLAV